MKRGAIALLFLLLPSAASCQEWQVGKSTHFEVFYHAAPADFVDQVKTEAEDCYSRITDKLGLLRHDFWLWENRARIYIHDDAAAFQHATNSPAWSGGCSIWWEKTVHTFYGAQRFFDEVLPHELGHIIFREFVGFDNRAVPGWMEEGVAQYVQKKDAGRGAFCELARRLRSRPTLAQLAAANVRQMGDDAQVSGYYILSGAAIEFLINAYGTDSFVQFCRMFRDSHDLEKALSYAYSIKNRGELDELFAQYLK
jgi:hypothetical protein